MSISMPSMAMTNLQSGSIESYVHSAYGVAMLTAEEEHELAVRLFDENDLSAAQGLIMSHLRFVIHIAKGVFRASGEGKDIVKIASSINAFQFEKGVFHNDLIIQAHLIH